MHQILTNNVLESVWLLAWFPSLFDIFFCYNDELAELKIPLCICSFEFFLHVGCSSQSLRKLQSVAYLKIACKKEKIGQRLRDKRKPKERLSITSKSACACVCVGVCVWGVSVCVWERVGERVERIKKYTQDYKFRAIILWGIKKHSLSWRFRLLLIWKLRQKASANWMKNIFILNVLLPSKCE